MKNSWLIWIFIVGVVITVFFAFNQQNNVPFNDIFPEDESGPVDIEYEFISKDHANKMVPQNNAIVQESVADEPVVKETISAIQAEKKGMESVVIEPEEVIPSKAEEIKKAQESIAPVETGNFKYTVQIASFKKKTRADTLLKELAEKKYDGFIMSKDLKEAGIWYRVYVGQFKSKKEAQDLLGKIKKDYKGSFIISPK